MFDSKIKVTVVVITYNSAATIKETLYSVLKQSYGSCFIELIISDDASSDNTKAVIESWLLLHSDSFYSVKTIFNTENGGVSKNCNIAWKSATSEWIKTIAGDDILAEDCIDKNVYFIRKNPEAKVFFSKMAHFSKRIDEHKKITPSLECEKFFDLTSFEQYEFLLRNSFNVAPTSFIKKEILERVGYCDEKYRLIEDLPLWLKLTKAGYKLFYFDSVTVFYRVADSISNSKSRLVNVSFICQLIFLHENEIWPNLHGFSKWRVLDKKVEFLSWLLSARIFNNKRHFFSLALQKSISMFRPSAIKFIFKKIMLYCKS